MGGTGWQSGKIVRKIARRFPQGPIGPDVDHSWVNGDGVKGQPAQSTSNKSLGVYPMYTNSGISPIDADSYIKVCPTCGQVIPNDRAEEVLH